MTSADLRTAALAAIEDGHFDDAERHLRQVIEEDPYDATAMSVLAACLSEMGRLDEAEQAASRAVELEPLLPYPHWVRGMILVERRRYAEAVTSAGEALRLDPDDPDHRALMAQCHAARERWSEALAEAEAGLRLYPHHDGCSNLRALALRQLGRATEASRAFAEAAEANPLNAFAAAGKGWGDLAVGRVAEADSAFRDALLFDPASEWAREGLLATIKSRSPVYRQLLRYFLWMSRRTSRERTLYAVGGVVGYSFLRRIAGAQPEAAPFIWPILIAYGVFVVLTWLAEPLLDLMVSFDADGRRLLGRDRLLGGRVVGAWIALAIVLAIAGAVGPSRLLPTALGVALLSLLVAGVFQCERGWPRLAMATYTAAIVVVLAIGATTAGELGASLFGVALVGIVLGTWLARWLGSITPTR